MYSCVIVSAGLPRTMNMLGVTLPIRSDIVRHVSNELVFVCAVSYSVIFTCYQTHASQHDLLRIGYLRKALGNHSACKYLSSGE